MKAFSFMFFFLFYSMSLISQPHTKLLLDSWAVVPLQGFAVGDSLLLTMHNTSQHKVYKYIWVAPDGKVNDVEMDELRNKTIFSVINRGDSIFLYYIEKKKDKFFIKTVAQHRSNGEKKIHTIQSPLRGELLGTFCDKNLFFVTYEKQTHNMYIIEISESAVVTRKFFRMPIDIFYREDRDIGFVQEGVEILSAQSERSMKFYKSSDGILISIDQFEPDVNLPANKSLFLELNFKTGEAKSKWLNQSDQASFKSFRTFVLGNYIYRVVDRKGFDISVFDMNSLEQIKTIRIDKKSPISDSIGFVKDHYSRIIEYNRTLWEVEATLGYCFITPIISDPLDSTIILKVGTFKRMPSGGIVPIPYFGPVIFIASSIAFLSSFNDNDAVEHYYYLRWDESKKTISYEPNPTGIGARIDNYELLQGETRYLYKGYVHGKGVSYGLYKKKDNPGEIDIVQFKSAQ